MKNTKIWKFFNSVKLSVVLFIMLSILSMVGTFIPQLEKEALYVLKYGERLYSFFHLFNIFDIYHSLIFQILIVLLTINIVVCSIDKIKIHFKLALKKEDFNVDRVKNYPIKEEFIVEKEMALIKDDSKKIFSKFFKTKPILKELKERYYIFGDKGRFSYLGVYIVHTGVLFILLGVLIGSIFGFEAFVNIKERSGTDIVYLKKTNKKHKLDFTIFCESFSLSFYENNGMPKEYRSKLILKKDNEKLISKDIIVNAPLRYRGINIFQSSYDIATPSTVTLGIESKDTGVTYNKTLKLRESAILPENLGELRVINFMQSYNFAGHSLGPTFFAKLKKGDKEHKIVIPVNFKRFDSMKKRDSVLSVVNYDKSYITGLQVTKDPGVFLIYFGFILLIIGCYIAFFVFHNSLCLVLIPLESKTKVLLLGRAKKNKFGINLKIKKIKKNLFK